MTLLEVSVVVAMVMVVAVVILAMHVRADYSVQAENTACINNLKQIGLAGRIWEGDNGDLYPAGLSVTKGGAKELLQAGGAVQGFLVMSNDLGVPALLCCPSDEQRSEARTFDGLSSSNVSYFFGADATNDLNPDMMFAGDSNFEIGGHPVKPGLLSIGTNDPISWQPVRHGKSGNICFADGSVRAERTSDLQWVIERTEQATNHLAIP